MRVTVRTFLVIIHLCAFVQDLVDGQEPGNNDDIFSSPGSSEIIGGVLQNGRVVLVKTQTPYRLSNDLIVERGSELVIEPGVTVKADPQVGITVRGVLNAQGTEDDKIIFTSSDEQSKTIMFPEMRLVDGPTILAGRLQMKINEKWRSVCTNSRKSVSHPPPTTNPAIRSPILLSSWTRADMETACRQMGFQGGDFFQWFNREMPLKSRLLYEDPNCAGTENSLLECRWDRREMGSGVCDYHPDLGIQCSPRHDSAKPHWRGLRFEYAENENKLAFFNTRYIPESKSVLRYVNIHYAGAGRDYNTSSALHIEGVPPLLENLDIISSLYNGINITNIGVPVTINNCTIRNNRGYGVFINSSFGLAQIDGCDITDNGGDGVRFIKAEERPEENVDRKGYGDFCRMSVNANPVFPIYLFAEQTVQNQRTQDCVKDFNTQDGHVLTLDIIRVVTQRNNTAVLEIFDGNMLNNRLLKVISLRNNTRPQSITTTLNQISIKYQAEPSTDSVVFLRVMSGLSKAFDLNVSESDISENIGRGVSVDNLRSQVHVHKTSLAKNEHVAALHVTSGVGDINVTHSRISFNEGDGINVTYTGGSRNISHSVISSNNGYGVAIWLNNTKETEFDFINQTTVVEYSEIFKNLDVGILHGNYCGEALFNFTGNTFRNSVSDALEILTCWEITDSLTEVQIANNLFSSNEKIALKIYPALNLHANIHYNHFRQGTFGALLIKNKPLEEFNVLRSHIVVQQNYFLNNSGIFVANLALSPYGTQQYLLFHRNFVRYNKIGEPFQPLDGSVSNLNPRSRVAAPIVVGSDNVEVFRNIIENPDSNYEIGSHLEDQSKVINATYNWLGSGSDSVIFHRIFHRYDRYNLARINFMPILLHNSNPMTTKLNQNQLYVPKFSGYNSDKVGGEIEGEEILSRGEYIVERDITIRPGGKLTIEPGVTLKFPPSIGMMVGGKLEARGVEPDSIRFTLKENLVYDPDNETTDQTGALVDGSDTEILLVDTKAPIRLLGGDTEAEGRLQLKVGNRWGTVCNYGWTMENAALVCQQLGYVLNPLDWYIERSEIPDAGLKENVIMTNVRCQDYDLDITKCKSETTEDFYNSCDHDNDVGLRCYKPSWAGVRFSALAERSDLQYVTVERSGLLDYATTSFKPAIQLDFSRHNLENIKVSNNFFHGLGVLYSNIYTEDSVNIIKNSEFSNNKGAGVSLKQLGLTVHNSKIENNLIGIEHNPTISGLEQREIAGWFLKNDEETHYNPLLIPDQANDDPIQVQRGATVYLVTTKSSGILTKSYSVRCDPGWVIGIQLVNPIENRSTEIIIIYDSLSANPKSDIWRVNRDLSVFPTTSSAHGIIIEYSSGSNALGGTVIVLSSIKAPVQNIYNRIVKGPVPTITVRNTIIRKNTFGVQASYYNRYLDELGNHFLRHANDSFQFFSCEITYNDKAAVFVHSPHWDLHSSNISEITIMVNRSTITDNGKGFYHFSRDMRSSNNLFHYVLQDNTIERNRGDGFNVALPYVWDYNENFTHLVYMDNNSFVNNRGFGIDIDGHFAEVNMTGNVFKENKCPEGLLTFKGMEKKFLIRNNIFQDNNCKHLVLFSCNSQSEIIGNIPAVFQLNTLKNNKYVPLGRSFGVLQRSQDPTFTVGFRGIQKVTINRNLFSGNALGYELLAGIKTAKVNEYLNVRENWWGTSVEGEIVEKIFDFDDWNDHAIADFRPYLLEEDFQSSHSPILGTNTTVDIDNLKGRLWQDVTLVYRDAPYVILYDITVMPNTTLTIHPGVVIEFGPNVGILVLGTLTARGYEGNEIVMRPLKQSENFVKYRPKREKRQLELTAEESIRLCKNRDCTDEDEGNTVFEGFLEWFNKTTLQWIPMCDSRFTERNAEVVCRQLGFDPLAAFFDFDVRIDFHSSSLSRIWTWPEPLQCKGTEARYDDCPIRLNGQQFGHRHRCEWSSKFVFINCNNKATPPKYNFWGGVRFADPEFEQRSYSHRVHDIHTHATHQDIESTLQFVKISGAGILHNERSPAVQSVSKSPQIQYVEVSSSASHGINLISPSGSINLVQNTVHNSLGVGLNIVSLSGEGRESDESSFVPLKELNIPYNLFSLLDVCDPNKEIVVEERVLVYYKYDNHPVNCIKIFRSAYNLKPLGLRFLQFNLFNSSVPHGIPDFVSIYNGDIYNQSSTLIDTVTMTSGNPKKLFRSRFPSLSVKLFANGASSDHGFIAEVITLPISAIAFGRNVQHNISSSAVINNTLGALLYMGAGEVNPIVTIERNQFKSNCRALYGNFTTCKSAVEMDIQNTQTVFFRSNLVEQNIGGLHIKADSRGSATSLQGWIHNNLFVNNSNRPILYVEGRQSSPYQEVTIYRNYFTRNHVRYHNNIVLKQVVSNFTYNFVKRNIGQQNLEVSGFDGVRLNIYQTTTHNGFYNNYAIKPESKSTIIAGTAGQHYVDNIFFNPDNDYEIITVNRSLFEFNSTQLWDTKIDAAYNYWGFNTTLAVRGRIRDQSDDSKLLEVLYEPFYMNNQTLLDGKCPPGWELVGETCYMYVGAPMTFWEAKAFCQADNASMPYLMGNINYGPLYGFLGRQYQWHLYSDRVWVQHIDRINQCTIFAYQTVELEDCNRRSPFVCEIDPKVTISIQPFANDFVTIAVFGSISIALLLIIVVVAFWWYKSKYRHTQRLERRNSISRSLNSLRSIGQSSGPFETTLKRKAAQLSTRSTEALTKNSDYKKVNRNGSIDSMEKPVCNSSIEDSQSVDTYEPGNPNGTSATLEYNHSPAKYAKPSYDLTFKNHGFRDNSTFATNSNYQSQAGSIQEEAINDETPIIQSYASNGVTSYPPSEYFNTNTLPLRDQSEKSYVAEKPGGFLQELQSKLNKPPQEPYSPTYSSQLADMTYSPEYTTIGRPSYAEQSKSLYNEAEYEKPQVKPRTKSEILLETDFDYVPDHPTLADSGRSKSQPMETAM